MGEVVQVSHRVIYGKDRFYPENATGLAIAKLMKVQTFWITDLEQMKALGFPVEVVSVSLEQFSARIAERKKKSEANKTPERTHKK